MKEHDVCDTKQECYIQAGTKESIKECYIQDSKIEEVGKCD